MKKLFLILSIAAALCLTAIPALLLPGCVTNPDGSTDCSKVVRLVSITASLGRTAVMLQQPEVAALFPIAAAGLRQITATNNSDPAKIIAALQARAVDPLTINIVAAALDLVPLAGGDPHRVPCLAESLDAIASALHPAGLGGPVPGLEERRTAAAALQRRGIEINP